MSRQTEYDDVSQPTGPKRPRRAADWAFPLLVPDSQPGGERRRGPSAPRVDQPPTRCSGLLPWRCGISADQISIPGEKKTRIKLSATPAGNHKAYLETASNGLANQFKVFCELRK